MIVKETRYLHADNEEFRDWEVKLGEKYLESEAARLLHFRLYEVECDLVIDTETGEYKATEFRDNGKRFVPAEDYEKLLNAIKLLRGLPINRGDMADAIGARAYEEIAELIAASENT